MHHRKGKHGSRRVGRKVLEGEQEEVGIASVPYWGNEIRKELGG